MIFFLGMVPIFKNLSYFTLALVSNKFFFSAFYSSRVIEILVCGTECLRTFSHRFNETWASVQ